MVTAGAMAMSPGRAAAIARRLGEIRGVGQPSSEDKVPYSRVIADSFKRLGQYSPKRPSEAGTLERKLVAAGYRSREAMPVFIGIRLGCALLLFGATSLPLFGRPNVLVALGAAAIGYLLPTMVLGRL